MWLPPRLTLIGKEVFLNCVALQEVVIPTELRDIGNRAFCGCEQLQRFTPWTGVTLNSGCKQSTMPLLCVTSLKNPSGLSYSLQRVLIWMPLTRNSTTNIANIMPAHRRLQVGALASVCRIEGLGSNPRADQTPLAQTIIANSLSHMEFDDSSMISPSEKKPVMEYSLLLTALSGETFQVSLSVAKFDHFEEAELFNACAAERPFRQSLRFASVIHVKGDGGECEATLEGILT